MLETRSYYSAYEATQLPYTMDPDPLSQQQAFESDTSTFHSSHKRLPHSHHGTPAHEYIGFAWPNPLFESDISYPSTSAPIYQPSIAQPVPIPLWPSQFSSSMTTVPPVYEAPIPITTLPMAPPATLSVEDGSKPMTTGRRTLSDTTKRRMCEYAQDHPGMKQLEIGRKFIIKRLEVTAMLTCPRTFRRRQKVV